MEKDCVYRIKVDQGNIDKAFTSAMKPVGFCAAVGGGLKQKFNHGLCQILTANDIGPMECRQPEYDEKNCPDIAHLRK